MLDYPQPRYPRLKKPESIEELMPKARDLLNQPLGQHYNALKPGYRIKSGDKVLFVVLSEHDSIIIEVMCRAMRELGAHVDLLTLDSTPVAPPEEIGAHEAIAIGKEEGDYSYYYTLVTDYIRSDTASAMVKLEKYDIVIAGTAGPLPSVPVPWYRFNFPFLEDFASPLIKYPADLLRRIDDKVFEQINLCKVMRLTDPEGTDVKWTNYDDGRPFAADHVYAKPVKPGYRFGGKDDCVGVVAGTLNHMGAFPHCKAYIEDGQVVKVEGGGKFGEVWREKLEQYRNVKLPPLAVKIGAEEKYEINDPGGFWLFECAIGTIPGIFRLPREGLLQNYANCLHDRRRSGYVHCGFGFPTHGLRELIAVGLPWIHVHIHSIFPTLEGMTDKGETLAIISKGHLTALDDPEVREFASKYGNPDELLNEAWIPAIPGINVPGDYMKDYGQDRDMRRYLPYLSKKGRPPHTPTP